MGNKPIVHAPIATGSTEPRDIRDRFADFVNLKDFGAKGDGVTDDSTAWAAWRAALQNGGMPYIPVGDYLLDDFVAHIPSGLFGGSVISSDSYDSDNDQVTQGLSKRIRLFVDGTTGDEDNDGLTPKTPVQSIVKAIELSSSYYKGFGSHVIIMVSPGTYSGDLNFDGKCEYHVYFSDNTTINGQLLISDAHLYVESPSDKLVTINTSNKYGIWLRRHALLLCYAPLRVNVSNATKGICVDSISYSYFRYNITFQGTTVTRGIDVCENSVFYIDNSITFTNACSGITTGISCRLHSYMYIANGATLTTGIIDNSLATDSYARLHIIGNCDLRSKNPIVATDFSLLSIASFTSLYLELTGVGYIARARRFCYVTIDGGDNTVSGNTSTITVKANNYSSTRVFSAYNHSFMNVQAAKITYSGTVTVHCHVDYLSALNYQQNMTVTGSLSGARYYAGRLSLINTGTANANRLLGSTAGSVSNYSIYQ